MTYKITDIDPVTMTIEELEGMVQLLNGTIKRKKLQSEAYDKIFSSMNETIKRMSKTNLDEKFWGKQNNKDDPLL